MIYSNCSTNQNLQNTCHGNNGTGAGKETHTQRSNCPFCFLLFVVCPCMTQLFYTECQHYKLKESNRIQTSTLPCQIHLIHFVYFIIIWGSQQYFVTPLPLEAGTPNVKRNVPYRIKQTSATAHISPKTRLNPIKKGAIMKSDQTQKESHDGIVFAQETDCRGRR